MGDLAAARLLELVLHEAKTSNRFIDLNTICSLLDSKTICIIGGSSDAEPLLVKKVNQCDEIIAANGAAVLVQKYRRPSVIVVSDLDGQILPYIDSMNIDSYIFVVHAHGDNINLLKLAGTRFNKIMGTVQVEPPGSYTTVIGGFTDGDRALYLALHCKPSSIILIGMNFSGKVGWWSKPWLKESVPAWPQKKLKLLIANALTKLAIRYAKMRGIIVEIARNNTS